MYINHRKARKSRVYQRTELRSSQFVNNESFRSEKDQRSPHDSAGAWAREVRVRAAVSSARYGQDNSGQLRSPTTLNGRAGSGT